MTSTFVNNLALNEMATGDQSGSWGTVTNLNLEMIGQALGHGTRVIANASSDNITMGPGVLDDDRALYLKLTGGGQACTVTLLPATMSKVWIMENGTAAALTFTQGSGANVVIPAGDTKVIACTGGAGTAQIVYDVFTDLNLAGTTVVDDLTVSDTALVTGVLTTTAATVFNGGFASNAASSIGGTTPTLTIGDAGAEDAKIVFDGNAVDYHVGLDDSEDALQIGLGAALGTTPRITIRAAEVVVNDLGIDLNFRVESSNTAHLLFADGGEDVVGIGTPTPVPSNAAYKRAALHIHQEQGGASGSQIHMTNDATGAAAGNGMFIAMWQDDDVYFTNQESDGNIKFSTGGNDNVLVLNENGSAQFGAGVTLLDAKPLNLGSDNDLIIVHSGSAGSITNGTGDFLLDATADIILDSDNGVWRFKDDGTTIFIIARDGTSYCGLFTGVSDMDMRLQGNDGGQTVTALTLDMSDAGTAQFNHDIDLTQANHIRWKHQLGGTIRASISAEADDKLQFSTGSSETARMTIDTSGNVGINTAVQVDGSSAMNHPLTIAAPSGGNLFAMNRGTGGLFNSFMSTAGIVGLAATGSSGSLEFRTGTTVGTSSIRMTVESAGDVTIENGNLVVGTAGKGINFSAYGAGTNIDNNLLNDYEEGTFAPVYAASGTAFGAIVHNIQTGNYTKVGNLVTISIALRTGSYTAGSASGIVTITGLPFTAGGTDTYPLAINAQDAWTNFMPYQGWVSNTTVTLTNNSGGSDRIGYRTIPVANMTATNSGADKNRLYLMGTYTTTS